VVEVAGVVVEPLGQREVGQQRLAELDLHVAALGDPQRVVARHLGTSRNRWRISRALFR
jgi:hypothetical protein